MRAGTSLGKFSAKFKTDYIIIICRKVRDRREKEREREREREREDGK